ncbi:unnamed protein product [Orchesella dallaii]|uniref:Prostaglandin E synthase 2 n=1 Tax=Orchesella dallaii TaxID=48710 RepID=A0ABP1PJJ5_9HEXA
MRSSVPRLLLRRFISTGPTSCAPPPPTSASKELKIPFQQQEEAGGGKKRSLLWWGAVSLGIGTAVGVAVGYDQIKRVRTLVKNPSDEVPFILTAVPAHTPSRSMRFVTDASGLKLTLFQYQTCPFCCKVRAMLDFFGISYDIVEVNPVLRSQIKWSQTYKKVPILVVQTPQGEILQLNDSTMIVSALYSFLFANKHQAGNSTSDTNNSMYSIAKCYPTIKYNDDDGKAQTEIMNKYFLMLDGDLGKRTKEDILEERKWRRWADTVYVHTLSPNIYRTVSEAIDSFKYFDKVGEWEKNFPTWERYLVIYVGALAMWMIGKRLQKRHNLKADVRLSLFEESDYWVKCIHKKGGEFMGGSAPNLSDLAVYGVLSSIEGCEAFGDLMQHSKGLGKWYHNIKNHLKNNLIQS